MDDVLVLEGHDWLADLGDVLIEHLALQYREEFREVVHDPLPVALSNGVTATLVVSAVDEDLTLVEADVEGAYDSVLSHSQLELLGLVHFVADVVLSFLNEQDLIDFIKFVVNGFLCQELAWLKHFENLNHEVLVLDVVPCVETVINPNILRLLRLIWVVLREIKELLEVLDKSLE